MKENIFLLSETKALVAEERKNTHQIIVNLREIDRLQSYRDLHYPSLFQYLLVELGYSEGAAMRRITAARMTVELPVLDEKIAKGEISLSNVNLLKQFINEQEIATTEEKMALVDLVQGKSGNDAKAELRKLKAEREEKKKGSEDETKKKQTRTVVSDESDKDIRLHCSISKKTMEKLEKIQGLLAHKNRKITLAEVIDEMAEITLEKIDPARKKVTKTVTPIKSEKPTRTVPTQTVTELHIRANGHCENCGSVYLLEVHHKRPLCDEGGHELSNLLLLCHGCHRRESIKYFGYDKVASYNKKESADIDEATLLASIPRQIPFELLY
ncbi:MAG: HNH endonuclease [Oligoflexia bacterium]|nr:HNH endonuclease [Oligoflexia bacterium]